MNKEYKQYLQSILIILDILFLNFSIAITLLLNKNKISYDSIPYYYFYWVYLNIFWLVACLLNGTYFEKSIIHFETFTQKSVQVLLVWFAGGIFYFLIFQSIEVNKKFFLLMFMLWLFFLSINRFIYLGIRNYYKDNEGLFKKILILGYNDTAVKLASYLEQEFININVKGFVEDRQNINELTPYPVVSDRKDILKIANKFNVSEIYSTLKPEENIFVHKLINDADKECIRIKIVPNLSAYFPKPVEVSYIRDLPVLSPRIEPLEDIGNRIKKRFVDIIVSLFVIVFILSWLIPLIGIIIKLESKGPVFFIQKRTGKNKQPFNCLKFRSMYVNDHSDMIQAKKNDKRITQFGKFLRRTSLDEFPQFLNVFTGEMSLIGPRPHMLKHTDEYARLVDQFMIRHFSKPGITGWAQINGYRGEITDPKQISLRVSNDIWYLENWNVWLDIKIIFLTIYKVFKGDKNAY